MSKYRVSDSLNMDPFSTPILFIVFNRPHQTQLVFDEIMKIQPSQLYIAADGPRPSVIGDVEKSEQCKAIISNISWPCEVKTLFRNSNLGCKVAVSGAINWFFENVEEGIILEDDCVPNASFFYFCEQLLERYRRDNRIMHISGTNFFEKWKTDYSDYFFSYYSGVWGWATWRRAWNLYDLEMKLWNSPNAKATLKNVLADDRLYKHRVKICDLVSQNLIDTWDYQWTFSRLMNSGLSISPAFNLVSNIGFGEDATHTRTDSGLSEIKRYEINFPLKKNSFVAVDREYDISFYKKSKNTFFDRVRNALISLIRK